MIAINTSLISKQEIFPVRFFIITFLWSWMFWIPLTFKGTGVIDLDGNIISKINTPLIFLGAFGPAIGACLSIWTLKGKKAISIFLKTFLSLNFGWQVWTSVFLIFGLSTYFSWLIPELWGEERLPMFLPNVYIFPTYWLIKIFLGGGQEEIGWRGYIMPYMERQLGYVKGTIILGLIWALWHLPLWFIAGTSQSYMNFIGFCILTISYSFILSWIVKASGERPFSALVAHGTANAFIPLFPILVMADGVQQTRFWIWISVTLFISISIVFFTRRNVMNQNKLFLNMKDRQ